jgi:uncharacterized protein (DUF4415 family)
MLKPGPGKLPEFRTEEEEIRFWMENHPADWIEGPGDLIIRLKRRPKKQITIRIDEPLYEELRTVADENGVPYQRLMRELLRQSLAALRAERRGAAARRSAAQKVAAPQRRRAGGTTAGRTSGS